MGISLTLTQSVMFLKTLGLCLKTIKSHKLQVLEHFKSMGLGIKAFKLDN